MVAEAISLARAPSSAGVRCHREGDDVLTCHSDVGPSGDSDADERDAQQRQCAGRPRAGEVDEGTSFWHRSRALHVSRTVCV